jgi:hypothetical protein
MRFFPSRSERAKAASMRRCKRPSRRKPAETSADDRSRNSSARRRLCPSKALLSPVAPASATALRKLVTTAQVKEKKTPLRGHGEQSGSEQDNACGFRYRRRAYGYHLHSPFHERLSSNDADCGKTCKRYWGHRQLCQIPPIAVQPASGPAERQQEFELRNCLREDAEKECIALGLVRERSVACVAGARRELRCKALRSKHEPELVWFRALRRGSVQDRAKQVGGWQKTRTEPQGRRGTRDAFRRSRTQHFR